MKRLTVSLGKGLYNSKHKANTQREYIDRYARERNQLGKYEDTKLSPKQVEEMKECLQRNKQRTDLIKCQDCSHCQLNDVQQFYCHARHIEVHHDDFCKRAKPKF